MNRALPRFSALDRNHAAFFVLIGAIAVLLAAVSAPTAVDAARFTLLAAAGVAARIAHRNGALLFVSPFFLLAAISLFLYSLLPWGITLAPDRFANTLSSLPPLTSRPYIGNTADRFVVAFSAVNLTLAVIAAGRIGMPELRPILPGPRALAAVLVLIILLAGGWVASHGLLSPADWKNKQVLDAFPPLMTALAALAFLDSLARNETRAAGVLFFTLAVFLVLFPFIGAMKTGMFLAAAMTVLFVVKTKSRARVAAILGLFAIAAGLILANFLALRSPGMGPHSKVDVLVSKVAIRQMETGYCLNKMIDLVATDGSRRASPLYFLQGMVPRVLWRDKPTLSDTGAFAADFCFANRVGQSFSITLIGEPLLFADGGGLIAAAIFFVLAHGLILLGVARAGPAGTVALLALAPWLADFDQSFALYWANALKMFFYMLPVLVVVAVLAKRASGESAASSEPRGIGPR